MYKTQPSTAMTSETRQGRAPDEVERPKLAETKRGQAEGLDVRYKMTHSLLEQWRRATDSEADEGAYEAFLAALERRPRERTPAMQAGVNFEDAVNRYVDELPQDAGLTWRQQDIRAITSFGNTVRRGVKQVRRELPTTIEGLPLLLVGVADYVQAGILYDIKRVQRYEYGKYAQSTQHPMYLELFPEATRFDYLIYDGAYCYREQYRRGDYPPIRWDISCFFRYLRNADLLETYKSNWEVQA